MKLTQSAEAVLAEVARLLADGFSGEITLSCAQGGVRTLKVERVYRPDELLREAA